MNSPNSPNSWSPYPDAMLEIPRDASFFDNADWPNRYPERLAKDDTANVLEARRECRQLLVPRAVEPDHYESRMFGSKSSGAV